MNDHQDLLERQITTEEKINQMEQQLELVYDALETFAEQIKEIKETTASLESKGAPIFV